MPFPTAQLLILAAWAIIAGALVGWGSLLRRLLDAPARNADDWLTSFWLGWCGVVLMLQVWHLLWPVGPAAAAVCGGVGAIGLLLGLARDARWLRPIPRHLPAIVAALAVAVWLSHQALSGAHYGDVGAYFMPTVRWYSAHRILPGLGNLHGFFALNQSFFLYVAALDVGAFTGRAHHVANGILILVLSLRMVLAIERMLRLRRAVGLDDLFYAFMLPGTLALGVGIFLTSPNPDIGIFCFGTVATGELIALTADDTTRRTGRARVLVLLALGGVTAKLSFAGFALALLLTTAWVWWRNQRPPWIRVARELAVASTLAIAALGPWIIRNVIMSGFPFFPSAVVVLPVEWRVQTDVEGWLRNSVHPGGALAMFQQPEWYLQQLLKQRWDAPDVIGPLVVALLFALTGLARRLVRRAGDGALPFVTMLPALASLQYCLMLSPVPRYAGATVWLLAATAILLACADAIRRAGSALRGLAIGAIVLATTWTIRIGMYDVWLPLDDFEVMAIHPYEPRRLESGLVVNVPTTEEACWEIPLPCTPYPNPALRLRRPDDLGAGLMLDAELRARFPYEPGAAWVNLPSTP